MGCGELALRCNLTISPTGLPTAPCPGPPPSMTKIIDWEMCWPDVHNFLFGGYALLCIECKMHVDNELSEGIHGRVCLGLEMQLGTLRRATGLWIL